MEIQENSKEKEEISKNTTFELVETKEKLDICIKLRHLIFVIEQNVPLDLEIDGEDEKSDHGLLFLKEIPVGVIRIRFIEEEGIAKIERVGILEEYRGMGLGVMLMKFSVDYIKTKALDKKIKEIKLSSQNLN